MSSVVLRPSRTSSIHDVPHTAHDIQTHTLLSCATDASLLSAGPGGLRPPAFSKGWVKKDSPAEHNHKRVSARSVSPHVDRSFSSDRLQRTVQQRLSYPVSDGEKHRTRFPPLDARHRCAQASSSFISNGNEQHSKSTESRRRGSRDTDAAGQLLVRQLASAEIDDLLRTTKFTRREIITYYNRFRALAAMGPPPHNQLDKDTFKRGIDRLALEDDLFVNRMFDVLDVDHSGFIDWTEYIYTIHALEKGSKEDHIELFFKIYDINEKSSISKSEFCKMLLSSLLVHEDEQVASICETFADKLFLAADGNGDGELDLSELKSAAQGVDDIFELFGRALPSMEDCRRTRALILQREKERREERKQERLRSDLVKARRHRRRSELSTMEQLSPVARRKSQLVIRQQKDPAESSPDGPIQTISEDVSETR
eukprot:GILK01008022.1.p1 GENE.GILK01008022.1~~GILK01008022.1.p1  ORF type:complete len:426 (-),score=70.17 GILK01008022.1:294-1571(-)